jgi:hypothetical protein
MEDNHKVCGASSAGEEDTLKWIVVKCDSVST